MTYKEIIEMMNNLKEEHDYVGLRFEDKAREVNEICEDSKGNDDREDDREFPKFDTEEYAELPELPGVSTWQVESLRENMTMFALDINKHAYIIIGNDRAWHDSVDDCVLDDGEMVIENGQVAVIIK